MEFRNLLSAQEYAISLLEKSNPYQLYRGENEGCRCGCAGEYHDTGDLDQSGYNALLSEARSILQSDWPIRGVEVDTYYLGDTIVNIELPNNEAITLYFRNR